MNKYVRYIILSFGSLMSFYANSQDTTTVVKNSGKLIEFLSAESYNIKKVEDNKYVVELAVAGFGKSDVEITFEDGKLIVAGKAADDSDNENFLYKGIANRAFSRTFILNDQVEIKNAEMLNGMLKIFLERIIPEHKKPKKIEINEKPANGKSKDIKPMGELLMEDPLNRDL